MTYAFAKVFNKSFYSFLFNLIALTTFGQFEKAVLLNGCDNCLQIENSGPLLQNIGEATIEALIYDQSKSRSLCEVESFTINGVTFNEKSNNYQEIQDKNGRLSQVTNTLTHFRNNCFIVDTTLCYQNETFPVFDFEISKQWESVASTSTYQSPLLADIDNDCIPEIVMSGIEDFSENPRITSGITFLLSSNGESLRSISTAFFTWGGPTTFALADINGDGLP